MIRSKIPVYIQSGAEGVLDERISQARRLLASCTLCPRNCRKNRADGERGSCGIGDMAVVSGYDAHFGEEAPISGTQGSGTIFFAGCNLLCDFCQNFDISHGRKGEPVDDLQLAAIMLALQGQGCHNINFVTPSHVVPMILSALKPAMEAGLSIPLVYNTSGYDSVDTLKLLEGIFDIYMPDFKFWDSSVAASTCNAPDYPEVARNAIREMHHQVGDLSVDENGIAVRGLLVRHLVLPNGLAGTRRIMRFLSREISAETDVNIMSQYRPCGNAVATKGMNRMIDADEYKSALKAAREEGIRRLER